MISKENTDEIKGIAVILMVIHHLFGFPERIKSVEYVSIIGYVYKDFSVEYLIGNFGKICVGIFLFLSGIGFYLSPNKNYSSFKKRVTTFYKYYIYILIIVSFNGYFFIRGIFIKGKIMYTGGIQEFILNFIPLKTTYCGEWWFVGLYLQILIASPLIFYLLEKNIKYSITCHLTLYILYILNFLLKYTNFSFLNDNLFYANLIKFSYYQIIYFFGILTAKFKLYEMIKIRINPYLGILSIFFLRILTEYLKLTFIFELFFVFFFIYFNIIILGLGNVVIKKILNQLGKKCLNIWLIHSLYIYYFFQKISFFPKYSILILIWVILISFLTGNILEKIYKKIFI